MIAAPLCSCSWGKEVCIIQFPYWEQGPEAVLESWRSILAENLQVSQTFEIHCWSDEVEAISLAQAYGTVKETKWEWGTVVEGKVTPEFARFLLSLPNPDGNELEPNQMSPFFSIFLDNGFSSEHYGTELNLAGGRESPPGIHHGAP